MNYISILPENVQLDSSHRFLRLPHPRTGQPQLYLPMTAPDGREEILEVGKIGGAGARRRTWFVGESTIDTGSLLVYHRIDPLFLVIPIIVHLTKINNGRASFQPLSDLVASSTASSAFAVQPPFSSSSTDFKPDTDAYNADLASLLAMKPVRKVLRLCCERKVIPGISSSPSKAADSASSGKKQVYYRPSPERIISHLRAKVTHMAAPERYEQFDHLVRSLNRDGLWCETGTPTQDQILLTGAARIRGVIDQISQYLPPSTTSDLLASYDHELAPLSTYLANRSAAAAAAAQPMVNDKNKAGKGVKRKPPPASRGVEALKKVNTSSMSKLTSFFKPKDGAKK